MNRGCLVWTPTPPLAGRRTPRPGPMCVCVCSSNLDGSGGPASRARSGAPHLFLWPLRLSALLGPLRAGVAPSLVVRSPSPPFLLFFSFFFFLSLFSAPPHCLLLSLVSGPGCPGPWRCVLFLLVALRCSAFRALSPLLCCPPWRWLLSSECPPPSPPHLCLAVLVAGPCLAFVFFSFVFFSSCLNPRCLWLSLVSDPGCPGPWCCALNFFFSLCALACFVSPAWPLAAPCWLLPPPPPPSHFVSRGFLCCRFGPCFFFSSCLRPRCLWLSLVSGPGCPGPWRCVLFVLWASRCPALRALSPRLCFLPCHWLLPGGCCLPPPSFCVARFSSLPLGAPFFLFLFFFLAFCAPVVSDFLSFPAPGALGLGAVRCLLCWPPASGLSVRSRLFGASRLAVGCPLVVAAPPLCLAVFVAAARCCVPCAVLSCVSLGAVLRRAAARCAACCCAVLCCVV